MNLKEFYEEKRQFDEKLTELSREFCKQTGVNARDMSLVVITTPIDGQIINVHSEIVIKAV